MYIMKTCLALTVAIAAVTLSFAASTDIPDHPADSLRTVGPSFLYELPSEWATLDATGAEELTDWIEVWQPM